MSVLWTWVWVRPCYCSHRLCSSLGSPCWWGQKWGTCLLNSSSYSRFSPFWVRCEGSSSRKGLAVSAGPRSEVGDLEMRRSQHGSSKIEAQIQDTPESCSFFLPCCLLCEFRLRLRCKSRKTVEPNAALPALMVEKVRSL